MSLENLKKIWGNPSYYDHAQLGHEIIGELLDYPEKLKKAEESFIKAKRKVDEIKEQMDSKRFSLLASGVIDGKNAEIREAQVADKLYKERGALLVEKEILDAEEANYHLIENEYRALLSIARIIGKEF